jgi:hypothetical protein
VLRVKPRKLLIGVERCAPHEAAVALVLHAKQGEVEAGEVVVIDAAVDESCRQADLADVLLDGELWRPQRERSPVVAKYRMVGHACNVCLAAWRRSSVQLGSRTAVDVVLDAGLFGGIGKSSADSDLVSPMRRVDKGTLRAPEQIVEKLAILQAADVDGDIGQLGNLFGDEPVELFHLRPYLPSQGRGHANEARRLAAIAVDGDHSPLHSWL